MNHDPDTLVSFPRFSLLCIYLTSFQDSEYEVVRIGPFSTVSRARTSPEDQWVALKIAPVRRKLSKEPHDIVKELRILSSVSHANVWCSSLPLWSTYQHVVVLGHRYSELRD